MDICVKTCRVCGEWKLLSEFYGKRNDCKVCTKQSVAKNKIGYVPLHERSIQSRLKNLCTKAKLRTKEFLLTPHDLSVIWEKQEGRCAYTKLPLLATANQFNTASLDRIDSSKGYVVGNVQLVCAAINKMKQEYTEDLFLLLSLLVAQNNKLSDIPDVLLARYFPLCKSED
tara:strand:- start:6379 stop:6891 length:513 start_codon:yes stop_codon:yes gene_type:complete